MFVGDKGDWQHYAADNAPETASGTGTESLSGYLESLGTKPRIAGIQVGMLTSAGWSLAHAGSGSSTFEHPDYPGETIELHHADGHFTVEGHGAATDYEPRKLPEVLKVNYGKAEGGPQAKNQAWLRQAGWTKTSDQVTHEQWEPPSSELGHTIPVVLGKQKGKWSHYGPGSVKTTYPAGTSVAEVVTEAKAGKAASSTEAAAGKLGYIHRPKSPTPSWGKPLPYPVVIAGRRNNRLIEVAP